MSYVVRFVCGKTSTHIRVDAAVIHYTFGGTTSSSTAAGAAGPDHWRARLCRGWLARVIFRLRDSFEGAMVAGYVSADVEAAVQANIVAAGYGK